MTREMNKPNWHSKWCQGHPRHDTDNVCFECPVKNCEVRIVHVLDADWLPYIQSINERFKQCGKQ